MNTIPGICEVELNSVCFPAEDVWWKATELRMFLQCILSSLINSNIHLPIFYLSDLIDLVVSHMPCQWEWSLLVWCVHINVYLCNAGIEMCKVVVCSMDYYSDRSWVAKPLWVIACHGALNSFWSRMFFLKTYIHIFTFLQLSSEHKKKKIFKKKRLFCKKSVQLKLKSSDLYLLTWFKNTLQFNSWIQLSTRIMINDDKIDLVWIFVSFVKT